MWHSSRQQLLEQITNSFSKYHLFFLNIYFLKIYLAPPHSYKTTNRLENNTCWKVAPFAVCVSALHLPNKSWYFRKESGKCHEFTGRRKSVPYHRIWRSGSSEKILKTWSNCNTIVSLKKCKDHHEGRSSRLTGIAPSCVFVFSRVRLVFLRVTVGFSVAAIRFCRAEFGRPDPPAQVLLAGDPDVGPDVEVRGPSWKTDLLTRLQTQQVNLFFFCCLVFIAFIANYIELLEETFPLESDWITLQQPPLCWSLQNSLLNIVSCKTNTHIQATIDCFTLRANHEHVPSNVQRVVAALCICERLCLFMCLCVWDSELNICCAHVGPHV